MLVILFVVVYLWARGRRDASPAPANPAESRPELKREEVVSATGEPRQVRPTVSERPIQQVRPSAVTNSLSPSLPAVSVAETNAAISLPRKGTAVPPPRAGRAKESGNPEQEALSARLEAARAAQQQAENDAKALQGLIHAAAKNLKKECSSETFPRFIDRLKASFGSARCVYIKNSGDDLKCLNESEEDKIDVLAVNFLQELQKLCSPTDDVAKAVMPARKMRALSQALSGSEPKIREACILAVEIIQAVASGKEGNGGSKR